MAGWGKAGQRLAAQEVEARRRKAVGERNRRKTAEQADLAAAYLRWRHGLIQPATITMALDSRALDGPEVDLACGAREPDVDRWELGDLYPTWKQLLLLADITDHPVRWLCMPHDHIPVGDTTMRFHLPKGEQVDPPPVLAFLPKAVAATVDGAPDTIPHPWSNQ